MNIRYAMDEKGSLNIMAKSRILIGDDSMIVRSYLEESLTPLGYRVDTCTDGQSFLNNVLATPYSLIFLDQELPGISGLEIVSHMRRLGNLTPVILATSPGKRRFWNNLRLYGILHVLEKPIVWTRFMTVAKECLKQPIEAPFGNNSRLGMDLWP